RPRPVSPRVPYTTLFRSSCPSDPNVSSVECCFCRENQRQTTDGVDGGMPKRCWPYGARSDAQPGQDAAEQRAEYDHEAYGLPARQVRVIVTQEYQRCVPKPPDHTGYGDRWNDAQRQQLWCQPATPPDFFPE